MTLWAQVHCLSDDTLKVLYGLVITEMKQREEAKLVDEYSCLIT